MCGAIRRGKLLRMNRLAPMMGMLAFCLTLGMAAPQSLQAQETEAAQVDASPKGLIGLGLIGAELGLVIPAAAGLDDTWALITFPAVGALGGALAGHFLIDNNNREKAAVAVLVGGLALVVPSVVLTLALTAYDPDDEEGVATEIEGEPEEFGDEEEGTVSEPPAEVETESAALHRARVARAGGGLVRVGEAGWMLGVPNVSLMPTFTQDELALFGGRQQNELRLSLFSGAF